MATRHYIDFGAGYVEVVGRIRTPSPNTPGGGIAGLTSSARGGEYGSGGVEIDDPLGALDLKGWRPYYAEEDEATPSRIFTGFINMRTISQSDLFEHQGTARVWDCDLGDLNLILGLRDFRGAAAKRPAETDLERIAWMLAHWPSPDQPVFDNGGVLGTASNFDEEDLRRKFPEEALSAMQFSMRFFYLYWDPDAATGEEISLFWGPVDTARGDLSVSLSNVQSEINGTTVFAALNGQTINREPGFTYSGVDMMTKAGNLYRQNETTAETYIRRDQVVDNDRIGNATTMSNRVDFLLARGSTERDVVSCTVVLFNDQVNLIQEGYRIAAKFTHLPGYETGPMVIVQKRTIRRPANGALDRYEVDLELSNAVPLASGGGDPGSFPHPPATVPGAPDFNDNSGSGHDGSLSVAPIAGDQLVLFVASRLASGPISTPTGWTKETDVQTTDTNGVPDTSYAALFSKMSDGTEGTAPYGGGNPGELFAIWNFGPDVDLGGVIAVDDMDTSVLDCGTVAIPGPGFVYGCVIESTADFTSTSTAPGTDVTEDSDFQIAGVQPFLWAGHKTLTAAASTSVTGTVTNSAGRNFWGACSFYIASSAEGSPPLSGQWVYGETVATTAGVGTTAFPYSPGSLVVYIDGVKISTASYVETDPAAGTFTLSWTPDSDETVKVDYQGI